jgi:peroxiredoxin Q/BCP
MKLLPSAKGAAAAFRDLAEEFRKKNAQIWGVSFDTVAENAKFAQGQCFEFPLLCDTSRQIGVAYGAADSPATGVPRRITYVIGPDGTILQAHEKVDAKSHPRAILESLPGHGLS